jgi:dipeptidase
MKHLKIIFFAGMFFAGITAGYSCTSYLVTPGASVDGSSMISYAADSHIRYGELYHFKGGPQAPGSYFQAYYRGSHKPLAKIPYPAYTYNVIGYINEMQVALGETTFGGRNELNDTTGMIDYGSLMFYTLQTAKTARDAIRIISELVDEYGYYGVGESFSIADPYEVWIMEIVGKGTDLKVDSKTGKQYNANKGAVWVAIKIPDGYISAHANHARITTFPQKKSKESITSKEFKKLYDSNVSVIYAHDVISFARNKKYFNGKDEDFSFSDVYAPLDFGAARFCEARVWSAFNRANSNLEQYKEYAMGFDMNNRMPLYIKPDRKLSVQDLIEFKRDYLQGTEFDMTQDVGAGPWGLPIRWRPLTWKVDSVEYFHERTTVTQQTAFSFITQSRKDYPGPIGGIIWFGVDDTNLSVYIPMYAGMKKVPETFAVGNGSIIEYSDNSAFWTFNKLSHLVYLRYSLKIDDVRKVQSQLENRFAELVPAIDIAASELYKADKELAIDFITDFSVNMANSTVERWQELYKFLLVKYLDGNIKKEEDGKFLTNKYGRYPIVSHPNYPEWWLKLIIEKTGDKFIYVK